MIKVMRYLMCCKRLLIRLVINMNGKECTKCNGKGGEFYTERVDCGNLVYEESFFDPCDCLLVNE